VWSPVCFSSVLRRARAPSEVSHPEIARRAVGRASMEIAARGGHRGGPEAAAPAEAWALEAADARLAGPSARTNPNPNQEHHAYRDN